MAGSTDRMKFGFVVPWADAGEVGELAAAAEERRLGRTVRLGAGLGRRRVDLARRRGRPHVDDPPRHDAHTAVAPPPVGARQPGRDRRSAERRTGDPVRRARRRRLGVRGVRRGVRPAHARRTDGRVPRDRHRPVGRPAVRVRRRPLPRQADRLPDDRQHRAAAAGADLVRRCARAPAVDGAGAALGRSHPAGRRRRRRAPGDARRGCRRSRPSSATGRTTS